MPRDRIHHFYQGQIGNDVDHDEQTERVTDMSITSKATAEVFVTAFRALAKSERDEVLVRIARDRSLRQDLLDLATIAERRTEASRPFREYLDERRK